MSGGVALELAGVSKAYGATPVVRGVSLKVMAGEFLSLLGPSGCGKTTTLSMIAGFESTTSGEIRIGGTRVDHLAPEARNTGMVFQSYALFPHLSVRGNIGFGLRMRGRAKDDIERRVASAATLVRIEHLLDRHPRQLSGGQQQRVALARALVTEPAVLLLDEPFGALDRQLREDLQIELKTLLHRLGMTTIFVTHDQDEALSMSDRVALMNAGVIEQIDTPQALYARPSNRFVASFIGKANFISGRPIAGSEGWITLQTPSGQVKAPCTASLPEGKIECFVRPESVRILGEAEDPGVRLDALVAETAFFGDHQRVLLRLEGGVSFLAVLNPPAVAGIRWAAGAPVQIGWDPRETLLFVNGVAVERAGE